MAANIIALGYNPTLTPIPGTTQYGTLVVGTTEQDYSGRPGGIDWWASPDLDEMYSIGFPVPTCDHPTPIDGVTACLGFYGSMVKTEQAYIDTVNNLPFTQSIPNFITGIDAHNWLISNGYWSSYNYTEGPTITNYLTCGVVYYESASTSLLINDINTAPTYDFFDGKDIKNSSKVQYTVTKGSFTTVYDSSPEFVKLQLPDYDGNTNLVNLRKNNWIPETYKITTFENGLRKTTIERSELLSYEIFDSNGIIGVAMIGQDRFNGFYTLSGKTSTIYKLNETLYNVINETGIDDFSCPTGDLFTETDSLINSFKSRINDLESNDATTDQICTSILFEITYNMYTAFTPSVTFTIPEFVSYQIATLNAHYNEDLDGTGASNGNWNFSVAGIIIWNTPDPYNFLSYTYYYYQGINSYGEDVSTYKNNVYNSIYEYDLFYQFNVSTWFVSLNGVQLGVLHGFVTRIGCLYTKGEGLTNLNSGFSFGYLLPTEEELGDPDTTSFNDFKTLSHEIGHAFGAAHTWQDEPIYLTSPNSSLTTSVISSCASTSGSSSPAVGCRDIMSYASLSIVDKPLHFHPVRMNDMYNYLNNYNKTYPNGYDYTACSGTETTDPHLLVSIIDTNLTQSTNTFTVKYKTCYNETEYTYGSSFTYQQFPLTILISSLSVVSDCFEFTITENITSTQCVDTVNGISTENVLLLPSPSPTPVVEPQEIRTIYTKFNIL